MRVKIKEGNHESFNIKTHAKTIAHDSQLIKNPHQTKQRRFRHYITYYVQSLQEGTGENDFIALRPKNIEAEKHNKETM